MTGLYYILIIVSAILIILSIELALVESSILNMASALGLLIIALILGSEGLQPYLMLLGFEKASFSFFKVRNSLFILLGPSIYFIALFLPRGTAPDRSWRIVAAVFGVYLIMAVLNFLGFTYDSYSVITGVYQSLNTALDIQVNFNFWHYLFQGLFMVLVLYSLILIFTKYRKMELIYQKKQIRYFLAAILFYIVATHFYFLTPGIISPFVRYPVFALSTLLFAALYAYSIINYRFFNIRKTAFRMSKEYAASIIILLPVAIFFYLIREWVVGLKNWAFILMVALSLPLFYKLHQAILNLLSRFLKLEDKTKDYTAALLEYIGTAQNFEDLAESSINALLNSINCSNADFLIYRHEKKSFDTAYSATGKRYSVPLNEPFLKQFHHDIEMYERELVSVDPRFQSIKEEAQAYFRKYGTELVIPVYHENELPVIIHISKKMDNTAFTSREFALLSGYRNVIRMQLNSIILFEKDREARQTLRELDLASEIQSSIFQREIPEFENFNVAVFQKPVKQVSGDYSYVAKISEGKIGFIIADVSGKGISASLIAMVIHAAVNSQDLSRIGPGELMSRINELMTSNIHSSGVTRIVSFATVFCGFIDCGKKTLTYSNAGHLPMMIVDCKSGKVEELGHNAKPVGIFQSEKYPDSVYQIKSPKLFFLYTDGITEAMNSDEEEYGEERLIDVLRDSVGETAEEVIENVLESVDAFSGEEEQRDDITIIAIKS